MKKYIQLTAGRGPVECARAVTLVARELLKDFPDAELVESEPHNTEPAASFRSSKWCKHTTLLRGNPVKTFSGAL